MKSAKSDVKNVKSNVKNVKSDVAITTYNESFFRTRWRARQREASQFHAQHQPSFRAIAATAFITAIAGASARFCISRADS